MTGKHETDTPCDCCGEPIEPRFGRRSLLLGASGIACTGVLGLAAPALIAPGPARAQQSAPRALPDREEYLIKGGSLLTVDEKLGNIEGADIHVRNGEIAAIGANLQAPGAEVIDASRMIVMPGMIDTHFHIWTSIMRNMLAPGLEYFGVKRAFVPQMTPQSFYASDMLAMAESLNAGVTTLHNYCHHVMSPETVEAEMRAHKDSGMRALFTFGHHDQLMKDKLIDLELAGQVQKQWFDANSPFEKLVTFGLNSRGPATLTEKLFRTEMDWAFERGLPVAMHAGQGSYSYGVVPLKTWGYLGPKTIIVHFVHEARGPCRDGRNRCASELLRSFRTAAWKLRLPGAATRAHVQRRGQCVVVLRRQRACADRHVRIHVVGLVHGHPVQGFGHREVETD